MRGTLDVHHELLERDVPHEIVRLQRSALAVEELPDVLGVPAERCLAVRMFEADGALVGVLAPVPARVDPALVQDAVGASFVRPAPAPLVNNLMDYAARLVPPLPLPAGVTLLADRSVAGSGVVYAATGETGTALGIRADLLLRTTGARQIVLSSSGVLVPARAR